MLACKKSIVGRKIKIAIAGCGRIFGRHVDAISHHIREVELVAVCDVNPEALGRAVAETGAQGFSSFIDMLHDSSADIVVLCTPSGLHSRQAIMAAEAKLHVMTEKPMATRWHDGLKMVHACDEARVRLFVVKQNRCNPTLQLLKDSIVTGRFGKIYMVNVNVFWTRPQEYYNSSAWRGTWEFDGGAFMNQASHYVDLLDWLIGPIESVQAYTATLDRHIEVEDTGVMNVRWRSGSLGSVNVTMLTYPKNFEGSITILGENGTVRVGGVALNNIEHWEFRNSLPLDEQVATANYSPKSVYGNGHVAYYDNVIKTLRGEAEPATDGREGLKSLEMLIAGYLSARDGKRVALPLEF